VKLFVEKARRKTRETVYSAAHASVDHRASQED
jgi:hypothetical protein